MGGCQQRLGESIIAPEGRRQSDEKTTCVASVEKEREKKESKIIIIINRLCKEGFLLVPIGWCLDVDRSCEIFLSPRTNNGGVLPLTTPCRPARAPPDVQAVLGLERVLFSRVRLDAPTS